MIRGQGRGGCGSFGVTGESVGIVFRGQLVAIGEGTVDLDVSLFEEEESCRLCIFVLRRKFYMTKNGGVAFYLCLIIEPVGYGTVATRFFCMLRVSLGFSDPVLP